mmetsp:Transcript_24719/g.53842  ORF Transcript_24719/g.53842 Transcript_24719/m.53842 type:complete len:339 (+) Transcript_24719:954-1970(+)
MMPLLQMPKVLSAIWRQLSGSSMARWITVLLFRPVAPRQRGGTLPPSSWQGSKQTLQHSDSKRPPRKKSSTSLALMLVSRKPTHKGWNSTWPLAVTRSTGYKGCKLRIVNSHWNPKTVTCVPLKSMRSAGPVSAVTWRAMRRSPSSVMGFPERSQTSQRMLKSWRKLHTKFTPTEVMELLERSRRAMLLPGRVGSWETIHCTQLYKSWSDRPWSLILICMAIPLRIRHDWLQCTIFTVVRLFFTSLAATSLKLIFLLEVSSTLLLGTGRPLPVVPGSTGRAFGGMRCVGGGGGGSRASRPFPPFPPFPLPPESPSPRRCASFSQLSCDAILLGLAGLL